MKNIYTNSANRDDDLLNVLNSFDKLASVSIASPFLSSNTFLSKIINTPCQIRLIVRLCLQTPHAELQKLMDCDHAEVRYFIGDDFHSKIYIINEAYLFFGSSNFTYGGLHKNKELNIGLDSSDSRFSMICELFDEYWNEAMPLGEKELRAFSNVIGDTQSGDSEKPSFEQNYAAMLAELNRPKRERMLTPEAREAQIQGVRASLQKAVVCLNSRNEYQSLIVAAEAEYSHKRGYTYISAVCKGEKKHYKGDLWLFKEDYLKLEQQEVEELVNQLNHEKEREKIKEKYIIDRSVFDTHVHVLDYLTTHGGRKLTRQALSAKICKSKELGIPFCRITTANGGKYVFFAEYYQILISGTIADEVAIEKSLEELREYYEPLFDLRLGDCTAIDILLSSKPIYKVDGQYYKNKSSIRGYDEKSESLSTISKDDFLLDIEMLSQ